MKSSIQATIGVVALSLAAACGGGSSPAADGGQTVSEVALYNSSDRQQFLATCAAKEGNTVTYYTVQDPKIWQPLVAQFQKKYPTIKVATTRKNSTGTSQAIVQESEGRADKVDVTSMPWSSFTSITKYFTKYSSPEFKGYRPEDILDGGKLAPSSKSAYGLMYNTDLISEADAPKTPEDFLDPRWKGKLTVSSSTVGLVWVGMMKHLLGDDVIDKIIKVKPRMQDVQGSGLATLVAAGEIPMTVPSAMDNTIVLKRDGAPVKWAPVAAFWSDQMVGIAAKAKHPCASMLLIDFILSKDYQETLIDSSAVSARTDVDSSSLPKLFGLTEAQFKPMTMTELSAGKNFSELYKAWGDDIDRLTAGK